VDDQPPPVTRGSGLWMTASHRWTKIWPATWVEGWSFTIHKAYYRHHQN
jgi:hypothetical protein